MSKIIEFLFPELCNIFAESYNIEYLTKCCKDIEVIETRVSDEPAFTKKKVDMIYLGCMTESGQEKAAKALKNHINYIKNEIENGTIFLITGNAIELFGKYIDCDGAKLEGLGIFDFHAKRRMDEPRHNSQFVGHFNADNGDIAVVGHKSQFSFAFDANPDEAMMTIEKGVGMNENLEFEGVRRNNFFATYSLGPFLVQNPYFTKFLLRKIGLDDKLCFEQEAIDCYEYRLSELRRTL